MWPLISRQLTEAWCPLLLCDPLAESLLHSLYFVSPNPWIMLCRIIITWIPLSLCIPYSLLILFYISHSWRRKWQPTPVFLPGKSHGQRSLVDYSPSHSNLKVKVLVAQLSELLGLHGLWPTRLLRPWDSAGKNIGVGSHSLLQGIFPTQGLNLGLMHCRCVLCRLSHQGSILPNCSTQNIKSSAWVFFFFLIKTQQ